MWPLLLDMTKEESLQSLRCLELEAYASLVTALRAQGPLNSEKMKMLKEMCALLNITQDRHKAEVRRVVNDEKLNTIAYHVSGQRTTSDEWAIEGRRLCPLMPRIAPQTAFSAIADEVADSTSKMNKQLPSPSSTERKRSPVSVAQCVINPENNKTVFRVPEPPKTEESKKRKLPLGVENSSLAQHLIGSPKMSRIQQIYRQKTKARQKEQHLQMKLKQDQDVQGSKPIQTQQITQKFQQKFPVPNQTSSISNTKINILQNITVPPAILPENEVLDQIKAETNCSAPKAIVEKTNILIQPNSSDGLVKTKPLLNNTKLTQHITLKHVSNSIPGSSGEISKTLKVCPTRKAITTKSVTTGQKLIVVSNPQTVTNPSILHRTLTIPFVKNLSMKNFDKFKIVNPTSSTIQLTPISSTITTNSTKHKVVTVRTNQTVKKVIPLSQLQVLNAKGSIKVLPIGGKIVTKSNPNSTSAPIFIVNTANNVSGLTKSTSSTPVLMTSKMDEPEPEKVTLKQESSFDEISNFPLPECDPKPEPLEGSEFDFESHITQHTIQHLVENEAEESTNLPVENSTQEDIKPSEIFKPDSEPIEECQNAEFSEQEQENSVDNFDMDVKSEEGNINAEDEVSLNADEELKSQENIALTMDEDTSFHTESIDDLHQEDVSFSEPSQDNLSLSDIQADSSTIYVLDSQDQGSNDSILESYEVQQSSEILSIVGSDSNDKFIVENSEPECMQVETVQPEGELMDIQDN